MRGVLALLPELVLHEHTHWEVQTDATIFGVGVCVPVTDLKVTCVDTNHCMATQSYCGRDYGTPQPVVLGLDCCELGDCWGDKCH